MNGFSDEMQKTLRARLHFPAAKALHMTHVLLEITHGLLSGVNCQNTRNRGWKKHLLRAKNASGEPVKLIVFTRVEFQDGTHKEGTKRYEGSGRLHVHVLIFGEEMGRLKLEEVVSASMPSADFPMLRGKVACSQADKDEDSMWPT